MPLTIEELYADRTRMSAYRRIAYRAGVPMAFLDDAVQDMVVNQWLKFPGEPDKYWQIEARREAWRANLRYSPHHWKGPKGHAKITYDQILTGMETIMGRVIDEDQWWIVDATLDLKYALEELTPSELKAVLSIEDGKVKTPAQKSALYKARQKLKILAA